MNEFENIKILKYVLDTARLEPDVLNRVALHKTLPPFEASFRDRKSQSSFFRAIYVNMFCVIDFYQLLLSIRLERGILVPHENTTPSCLGNYFIILIS